MQSSRQVGDYTSAIDVLLGHGRTRIKKYFKDNSLYNKNHTKPFGMIWNFAISHF